MVSGSGCWSDERERINGELKSKGRIERERQLGSKVKGSSVLQSISKEMASLWKAPSKGVLILIQRGVLIFSVHRYACMHAKSLQSCPTLWTVACQAPLSMGILQARYWSGLPFPSPGHLLNPDIEPASLMSPALVDGFFTTSTTWGSHSQMGRKNYLSMSWTKAL